MYRAAIVFLLVCAIAAATTAPLVSQIEPESRQNRTEDDRASIEPAEPAIEARSPQLTQKTISDTPATVGQPTTGLILLAIILAIALTVSVLISFYLYRWRRILLSSPHLLVPEELGERIRTHEDALRKIESAFVTGTGRLAQRSDTVSSELSNLIDTFMALQGSIDEKDHEIKRLKTGYDAHVFRKFLFRFVRVHQTLCDFEEEGQFGERELNMIKKLLDDALDECGVEVFEPDLGQDYREVEGVADNPKKIPAENIAEDFMIAEVTEPGYRMRTSDNGHEIVTPAKVKIFMGEREGEPNGNIHRN